MSLFEITTDQRTPVEVADRDGQPYLRLLRGAPVTPELVRELNDLIGPGLPTPRDDGETTSPSLVDIASIPVPGGVVRVSRRQRATLADLPDWVVTMSLVGCNLTDTADLTVAGALAVADTLRQAALEGVPFRSPPSASCHRRRMPD